MSCGKRCCTCKLCCCCGKRGATILFALIGLVLAAGVIVPPVYVHETDRHYEKLFPILSYGRAYLEDVTNQYYQNERGQKHAYQTQNEYPMDEVAASTIEDLDMTNDNMRKIGNRNNIPDQRQIQPDLKSIREEAGRKYK